MPIAARRRRWLDQSPTPGWRTRRPRRSTRSIHAVTWRHCCPPLDDFLARHLILLPTAGRWPRHLAQRRPKNPSEHFGRSRYAGRWSPAEQGPTLVSGRRCQHETALPPQDDRPSANHPGRPRAASGKLPGSRNQAADFSISPLYGDKSICSARQPAARKHNFWVGRGWRRRRECPQVAVTRVISMAYWMPLKPLCTTSVDPRPGSRYRHLGRIRTMSRRLSLGCSAGPRCHEALQAARRIDLDAETLRASLGRQANTAGCASRVMAHTEDACSPGWTMEQRRRRRLRVFQQNPPLPDIRRSRPQ